MAKLVWDNTTEKRFEAGVDHGVLYVVNASGEYKPGVVWNGLTSVSESPEGGDENAFYADNIKYGSLRGTEDFGGSIEAYTYPTEWEACDGSATIAQGASIGQQTRKTFGLSYRTLIGNDEKGLDYGYRLHLIYAATASPSERSYETINDSPDAITLSWDFTTNPIPVGEGFKNAAQITIDSTKADPAKLATLEEKLYGTNGTTTYSKFSGNSFEKGVTYYELNGETYVATKDTEPQSGKTYYTASISGATIPYLPLPAEVISTLGGSSQS